MRIYAERGLVSGIDAAPTRYYGIIASEIVQMTAGRHFRWPLLITCLTATLITASAEALATPADDIAAGDRAWTQRADGHRGSQAAAQPIQTAIDAYTRALGADPENLEARWKLLRAFHFKGEFVLDDGDQRLELFRQGREYAKTGVLQIEREFGLSRGLFRMEPAAVFHATGDRAAVAEFYFWASANWGLWAQYSNKLIAALTGVVSKIRQFAGIMVLMDERVENGGAHRLLGHFNAVVPKIPLFMGWVDRDLAISELRLSLQVAPDSLLSKIYLAEALLKFSPGDRQEALGLLHDIVKSQPDPERLVEDTRVIEDAGALLKSETV